MMPLKSKMNLDILLVVDYLLLRRMNYYYGPTLLLNRGFLLQNCVGDYLDDRLHQNQNEHLLQNWIGLLHLIQNFQHSMKFILSLMLILFLMMINQELPHHHILHLLHLSLTLHFPDVFNHVNYSQYKNVVVFHLYRHQSFHTNYFDFLHFNELKKIY